MFHLDVDISDGDAVRELGRILRYWAGNLRHYELKPGDGSTIYDSAYKDVGRWRVVDGPEAEPQSET
ncbi:MAG: hypothetical protein ACRDXX_21885 [Stackebrandtia sp.]